MNTINIEKRFEERLAVIRRAAEGLPTGKKLLILNNCSKLSGYAKVAGKQLATAHTSKPHRALYDARTDADMANEANAKKKVWAALLAGRTLSIEDQEEFSGKNGTTQMHTIFCKIRQDIAAKNLPYTLCDEWVYPGGDRSKFKRYWLTSTLNEDD